MEGRQAVKSLFSRVVIGYITFYSRYHQSYNKLNLLLDIGGLLHSKLKKGNSEKIRLPFFMLIIYQKYVKTIMMFADSLLY